MGRLMAITVAVVALSVLIVVFHGVVRAAARKIVQLGSWINAKLNEQ